MLTRAVIYLLVTLFDAFVMAVLLRFYAQAFRASFRNPIAQFVVALTDWAVKPLRRLVPQMLGLDSASLVVAWVVQIALWGIVLALHQATAFESPLYWVALAAYALVMVLKLSIYLLIGVVIIDALLSWINPHHPIRPFFDVLSRPFLRPLQRVIPPVGGGDLSVFVLLIALQLILMLPLALLEKAVCNIDPDRLGLLLLLSGLKSV